MTLTLIIILGFAFFAFRSAKDTSDYNSNKGKYKNKQDETRQ